MTGFINNSYIAFSNFVDYYTHRYWRKQPTISTTNEALRQLGTTLNQSMKDLHATQELYHQLSKDYQAKLEELGPSPRQENVKAEYHRIKEVWTEAGNEVREMTEKVNRLAKDVQQKLNDLRQQG